MFTQTDAFYEVEVGTQYLCGSMVGEHTHQQSHNALHDECVALGLEVQQPVHHISLQPHTALASVYQVLLCLVLVIELRLVSAQVYEQLVSVHPVVEVGKLFNDFVLNLVYCHSSALSL